MERGEQERIVKDAAHKATHELCEYAAMELQDDMQTVIERAIWNAVRRITKDA